jgi:hypothetical protein
VAVGAQPWAPPALWHSDRTPHVRGDAHAGHASVQGLVPVARRTASERAYDASHMHTQNLVS